MIQVTSAKNATISRVTGEVTMSFPSGVSDDVMKASMVEALAQVLGVDAASISVDLGKTAGRLLLSNMMSNHARVLSDSVVLVYSISAGTRNEADLIDGGMSEELFSEVVAEVAAHPQVDAGAGSLNAIFSRIEVKTEAVARIVSARAV